MTLRHVEALRVLMGVVGVEVDVNTIAQLLGKLPISGSLDFWEEQRGLITYLVDLDCVPLLQKYVELRAPDPLAKHGRHSQTLLFWALSKAMAALLISYGVDPNSPNYHFVHDTPLLSSMKVGNLEVVEYLCAHAQAIRIDPNAKDLEGRTGLHLVWKWTSKFENAEFRNCAVSTTRGLLKTPGIDANIRDPNGMTALHYACHTTSADGDPQWELREEIVRLLLSNPDVDVNLQDNTGSTTLHYLCESEAEPNPSVMIGELLSSQSAFDPNIRDKFGLTVLHRAVSSSNMAIVEKLASSPALDPDIQNYVHPSEYFQYDGTGILLHLAVQQNNSGVVKCLLSKDWIRADELSSFRPSVTPLMLASNLRSLEIIELLALSDKVKPSENSCRALAERVAMTACWEADLKPAPDPFVPQERWKWETFRKLFEFALPWSLHRLCQKGYQGRTSIWHAANTKRYEFLEKMLDICSRQSWTFPISRE